MKSHIYNLVHRGLAQFGVRLERDRPVRDPLKLMALKAREFGIHTILDIGANVGQFGLEMRHLGYDGPMVSFEPLSVAHETLSRVAKRDGKWHVAPRMALGSEAAVSEINVSHNLASSSLLQVKQRSIDAAPVSGFSGREQIQVRCLDEVIEPFWEAPFAMKLDTQGFEIHVMRGATATLNKTVLVMVEMSLVPLYEGGARFVDVYSYMEKAGFRCIALTQGFADYEQNELLQVDGVFARDQPNGRGTP